MAETLKSSLIQFRRLYPHCEERLDALTREDFIRKNDKYLYFVSYMDKLTEIYKDIIRMVNELPGILTQTQIDSLHTFMRENERKLNMLKQPQLNKEKKKEEEKEILSEEDLISENEDISNQYDFEQLSLASMRKMLGLGEKKFEEKIEKDDSLKDEIMNEIINSTQQIREESETIRQRIVESNKSLDETQSLQEQNLHAVQKETKQIKKITSSFCGTLFQDIKILFLVGIALFICFVLIFILPKPK